MLQSQTYRDFLVAKFEEARAGDPRLSMRKFAKMIGLTPSNLSDILKGRSGLSGLRAKTIATALSLNDYQSELLVDLVESEHARGEVDKQAARQRLAMRAKSPYTAKMGALEKSYVAKWYYVATLELLSALGGVFDEKKFAVRLRITVEQVLDALSSLLAMGLVVQEGEKYRRASPYIFAQSPTPSESIRGYHKQVLDLAESAIAQPIGQRKFLSTMMPFDSKRIDEARAFLEEVDREFSARFDAKDSTDTVYCLGLQFFRIDTGASK